MFNFWDGRGSYRVVGKLLFLGVGTKQPMRLDRFGQCLSDGLQPKEKLGQPETRWTRLIHQRGLG